METSLTATTLPLASAEPESIEELFSRDPLELSAQDIDKIIAHFRLHRKLWSQEEASAKSQGRTAKAAATKALAQKMSLGDLSLDL